MGIFGFEAAFCKAVNEVEVAGVRKHYANAQTNEVVCVLDTKHGIIYDTDNNIMEDQARFKYLIDMEAIMEVESHEINEGIKLSDLERGSYLHEAKASYILYLKNPNGVEQVYLTKTGEILYSVPADNPAIKITDKDELGARYGSRNNAVTSFPEVKNLDTAQKEIDKKISLGWDVKLIKKA